jgi:hypothetical protein
MTRIAPSIASEIADEAPARPCAASVPASSAAKRSEARTTRPGLSPPSSAAAIAV